MQRWRKPGAVATLVAVAAFVLAAIWWRTRPPLLPPMERLPPAAVDAGALAARDAGASGDAGPASDGGAAPLGRGEVTGSVLDEGGRPVVGATLRAVGVDASGAPVPVPAPEPGDSFSRLEAIGELGILHGPIPFPPLLAAPPALAPSPIASDAAGRFRIAGLPAGRFAVTAVHPDFLDGRSEDVVLSDGGRADVRVVLRRGAVIGGRVVDERGVPIAGAEVWRDGALLATTDGRGAFQLARLEGPTEIEARAAGRLPARRTVDPLVDREIELALAPAAGLLRGVVLDDRGFPVGGAAVTVEAEGFRKQGTSGARGDFAIDSVPPGRLRVAVAHVDHPIARVEGAAGEELRVVLGAGGGVEGEARDVRSGVVPRGLRVTVESGGTSREAPVDQRGRFRALGCTPGAATVRAAAPGYLPASLAVEIPAGESARDVTARDVRVDLILGGTIAGEVRDDRGALAGNVEVEGGGAKTRTDAAGRFRLGPIEPGRIEVHAGGAGDSVVVDPGRETRCDLQLR